MWFCSNIETECVPFKWNLSQPCSNLPFFTHPTATGWPCLKLDICLPGLFLPRDPKNKISSDLAFSWLSSSVVVAECHEFAPIFPLFFFKQSRMTQHLKLSVDATHFTSPVRFWPAATEFGLASPRDSLAKVLHAICRGDNGLSLASGVFFFDGVCGFNEIFVLVEISKSW